MNSNIYFTPQESRGSTSHIRDADVLAHQSDPRMTRLIQRLGELIGHVFADENQIASRRKQDSQKTQIALG
jgi:hypothetical protein